MNQLRFIKGFSKLSAPLTKLTKTNAFIWSEGAQYAFEELKKVMSTCPTLVIPNFSMPFVIECDASGVGIGAILMQRGQPIAFESRKLTPVEKSYSIYEKEMLTSMHALTKFKQYLICGKFTIKTDHNNLKFFLDQEHLNERQQRWVTKVQSYDFEIEYKKGKTNKVADASSRNPLFYSFSAVDEDWKVKVMAEYVKNDFTAKLLDGQIDDVKFRVHNGLIFYKDRIFIVPESKLKHKIISALHDAPYAGHPGFYKTYKLVREKFSWKRLKDDVMRHAKECIVCQQNKTENTFECRPTSTTAHSRW